MATYRGRIEQTVGRMLDQAASAGEFDLVSQFAAPLPIAVITDLLGVPDANAEEFARYGASIGSALDGIKGLRHAAELQASQAALEKLFNGLFELRRREPADDIISALVAAEGDQIRPGEMLPMCVLLLVAGFETTVNLIGNAVLALLDHPDQWAALCADPGAWPGRGRGDAPLGPAGAAHARTALETVELEGRTIAKGELVATLIGAANRDPEAYERPGSSTSPARAARITWPSPAASTTASASRWPASRAGSRCSCWPSACPACSGQAPSSAATRR